jgi:hypothetical protein
MLRTDEDKLEARRQRQRVFRQKHAEKIKAYLLSKLPVVAYRERNAEKLKEYNKVREPTAGRKEQVRWRDARRRQIGERQEFMRRYKAENIEVASA